MNCPNCQTLLANRVLKGAAFQYCGEGKGVWMDRKALTSLHKQFHHRASALPVTLKRPVEAPRIKSRNCPQCEDAIFRGFDFLGVALDRCQKCNGLWFDAGEVDAALKKYWKARPNGIQSLLSVTISVHNASTPLGGIISEPMAKAGRTAKDFIEFLSIFMQA